MKNSISTKNINSFKNTYNSEPQHKITRNALTQSKIQDVAMNWDAFSLINHEFSDVVDGEMKKVTNQKQSGRCWGFAGLNLMRIALSKKYKLKQFEFSQNYFMFWDKLEKSNYFLENIIKTLDETRDSRIVMHLVSNPIEDGGQWDMFVNLIEKYGIVPQTVMPESYHSSQSGMMNRLITRKLREYAWILREMHSKGKKIDKLRAEKEKMLETVYSMLCVHLGTPPEKFDWQVRNKDKEFERFEGITPQQFYTEFVDINLKDKICLINCPMDDKKYDELYTIQYLGNVIEGQIVKYINLTSEQLKEYAIKSIKDGEGVWFGCDVGKMFHQKLGIMDMDLYDFDLLYKTEFKMDKAKRLEYGDSLMTHAMLLTGVDIKNGKSLKWRVENSWGDKIGDKGYHLMSDKWFDEYLYEIVIDKKYLSKEVLEIHDRKPIELASWDPMGALAK
ncbi:MAG: C1 family peptidase [Candidatus Marinimicrobia bacterium]|nr:C1 family peptidase [Candidatus Neomarinimicrobiota bacterium]MBL7023517.1 C1 family peptidase [Candidatus Neomarinimicrobiota bacterium]MBL7109419.1 C1 family peptidase [Candidatus Neomarinimicrobiota bacterium]